MTVEAEFAQAAGNASTVASRTAIENSLNRLLVQGRPLAEQWAHQGEQLLWKLSSEVATAANSPTAETVANTVLGTGPNMAGGLVEAAQAHAGTLTSRQHRCLRGPPGHVPGLWRQCDQVLCDPRQPHDDRLRRARRHLRQQPDAQGYLQPQHVDLRHAGATAQPVEVILSFIASGRDAPTYSAPAGYTLIDKSASADGSNYWTGAIAYKIVNAIGTYSASWSPGSSGGSAAQMMVGLKGT